MDLRDSADPDLLLLARVLAAFDAAAHDEQVNCVEIAAVRSDRLVDP